MKLILKIVKFAISLIITTLLFIYAKNIELMNLNWLNFFYSLILSMSFLSNLKFFFDILFFVISPEKDLKIDKETEAFNQLKNIDDKYIEKYLRKKKLKSIG